MEKPAGCASRETAHLAQMAGERGLVNMVGLNRRYYSVVQQALLAVLQLGPIRGIVIEAHEPISAFRSRQQFAPWLYDNWMLANSIHMIDLVRLLGGHVVDLKGFGVTSREPNGDNFTASMRTDTGALATFIACWDSAGGNQLRILGRGIAAELTPETGVLLYSGGRRFGLRPDWADQHFKPGLYAQNSAFLHAVCNNIKPTFPASDLADNVHTMQLVERIQETLHDGAGGLPRPSRTLTF